MRDEIYFHMNVSAGNGIEMEVLPVHGRAHVLARQILFNQIRCFVFE